MENGIYVIKDGPFSVTSNSTVFGEGVGFYLTGDDAVYNFGSLSDINFSAPEDGPMAGMLFLIAAILLSLIFFKRFKKCSPEVFKKGALIGFVLAASFIFHTIGIKYTTASKAAFITG